MAGRLTEDSKKLLEYVGGRESIATVSHCVTRMRFVLNDSSRADTGAIESLASAKGTFTQAGQFQVIIGNEVSTLYNDFVAMAEIEGVSKDVVKRVAKQNQNMLRKIMSSLAEIFAPLIPAIMVGGLILGFHNIIEEIALFDGGTRTLTQAFVFQASMNSFLWLIGEAMFHSLSVCIVWSITKKMGTTQALGIVLGITLISPQLLNVYSVASTATAEIPKWNFGFTQADMIGHQAQVLPAVLVGFTLVYLERSFRKICPSVISMIVVPFCSLILSVVVAHGILEPVGQKAGAVVSDLMNAGLTSSFKGVFAAVFGFFYVSLIIAGLHRMSNAIDLQLIADFGGTTLRPMIALSNIVQGSAVLAMICLQERDAEAKEVSALTCISCYLGVTEPAIFDVSLKYEFPFICGMAGSAVAATPSVMSGVKTNAIGVDGIPGVLSVQPQYMGISITATVVVTVIPSGLTFIIGERRGIGTEGKSGGEREKQTRDVAVEQLTAYVSGRVIPMEEVPDQVFASKALGDGVVIEPEDEVLRAPADGTVAVVMDGSLHTCGLVLDDRMEVLLHIGLDIVDMSGEGFEALVKPGGRVNAGDQLIRFNRERIRKANHPDMIIVVVTNLGNTASIEWKFGLLASAGADAVAMLKRDNKGGS